MVAEARYLLAECRNVVAEDTIPRSEETSRNPCELNNINNDSDRDGNSSGDLVVEPTAPTGDKAVTIGEQSAATPRTRAADPGILQHFQAALVNLISEASKIGLSLPIGLGVSSPYELTTPGIHPPGRLRSEVHIAKRRRSESIEDRRSPDERGNHGGMTIKSRLDPVGEPTGQRDVTLQELSRKVSVMSRRWFGRLPPRSISSFSNLSKAFIRQFMGSVQRRKSLAHLSNLKQEPVIAAFTNGLQSGRLSFDLRRERPKTYEEMMEIAGDYALAEEEEVAQGGSYVHGHKPDSKSDHKDDKKTQSRDRQRDDEKS
ncbi:hypothetical protein Q3G72_001401 [Acer saccharum]|nr:hypothetical protein Q3G72_001401 [Acer saccharum]